MPDPQTARKTQNFHFYNYEPQLSDIRTDVLEGLRQSPKTLPPKLLYDEAGSQIFVDIVQVADYYLPKVEREIMQTHLPDIAKLFDKPLCIVEPGAGDCTKIRQLLDSPLNIGAYVPLEIEPEILKQTAGRLAEDYPDLEVHAVCADYMNMDALPDGVLDSDTRNLIYFPGSSIGNYEPDTAMRVLGKLRKLTNEGALLIGVDTQKDADVLERAYDDSEGVTARFNLNLLKRMQNELDAELNTADFAHKAVYNTELGRIEMHLVAERDTTITIDGERFSLAKGETIHTECSYKYRPEVFAEKAQALGYAKHRAFIDDREHFSVHVLW